MQNSEFAHDPESFAPLANVAKNALKKKTCHFELFCCA